MCLTVRWLFTLTHNMNIYATMENQNKHPLCSDERPNISLKCENIQFRHPEQKETLKPLDPSRKSIIGEAMRKIQEAINLLETIEGENEMIDDAAELLEYSYAGLLRVTQR